LTTSPGPVGDNAAPFRTTSDAMPRKLVTRRSTIHGNGVFAGVPIAKGERLIQYKGKLRSHAEVDRAYAGEDETGHTFLFTLNDDYVIDANIDGNDARWINHSCSPNCEAVTEEFEGDDRRRDRVFIEARRAIKPGEELTYNYGIVLSERHTPALKKLWACRCGSRNCTGTMLQPKRKPAKRK
jgi:SET domain-containing protein